MSIFEISGPSPIEDPSISPHTVIPSRIQQGEIQLIH